MSLASMSSAPYQSEPAGRQVTRRVPDLGGGLPVLGHTLGFIRDLTE